MLVFIVGPPENIVFVEKSRGRFFLWILAVDSFSKEKSMPEPKRFFVADPTCSWHVLVINMSAGGDNNFF